MSYGLKKKQKRPALKENNGTVASDKMRDLRGSLVCTTNRIKMFIL